MKLATQEPIDIFSTFSMQRKATRTNHKTDPRPNQPGRPGQPASATSKQTNVTQRAVII